MITFRLRGALLILLFLGAFESCVTIAQSCFTPTTRIAMSVDEAAKYGWDEYYSGTPPLRPKKYKKYASI